MSEKRRRNRIPLYLTDKVIPKEIVIPDKGDVLTYPKKGEENVSTRYVPRVVFIGEVIDRSTLNQKNVFISDEKNEKVPCSIEVIAGNTVLIYPYKDLAPNTKYTFRISSLIRDIYGADVAVPDKQIFFTTGG